MLFYLMAVLAKNNINQTQVNSLSFFVEQILNKRRPNYGERSLMIQKRNPRLFHWMVLVSLVFTSACTAANTSLSPVNQPMDPDEISQNAQDNLPVENEDQQQVVEVNPQMIKSNLPRTRVENLPAEIVSSLVQANNQFAFDFYSQIKSSHPYENLVISPYSINLALAMVSGGASGQTLEEMRQVLNDQALGDQVHLAWNALSAEIESRADSPETQEAGFDLKITNAIWGQSDYSFEQAYLDNLAENYDAGLRLTDFKNEPDTARVDINDWVSEQTNQRIAELIPDGAIHPLTRLAIINTVYFKAPWRFPFDPANTTQEFFTQLNGEQVEVPMMHQTQDLPYLKTEDLSMVVFPYSAGKLEMILIQPSANKFEAFEQTLTHQLLKLLREQQQWGGVRLSLPRYQFSTDVNLIEALTAMGMPSAFNLDQADFSGITREEQIYIDAALHEAFIDVNEEGTEAAGATAILLAGKGMPVRELVEISLNSPFFFILQDRETGTVLFFGRVMNPLQN